MGLLEKLLDGTQGKNLYQGGNFSGGTPSTRSGAEATSQMHAQGNFGDEAEGFGKVTKGFVAKTQAEATNVKYKTTGNYSELDLDGKKPANTYRDSAPEGRTF